VTARYYVTVTIDAAMPKAEAAKMVLALLQGALAERDIAAAIARVDVHDSDEDLVLEQALRHAQGTITDPRQRAILQKLAEHTRERQVHH
jgi:hypothetical protein